jgi:hypothetical protein
MRDGRVVWESFHSGWQVGALDLVPSGSNRLIGQLAPSYVTCSDHAGPIGGEAEDAELPGGRQMWYEVIRTTSLLCTPKGNTRRG